MIKKISKKSERGQIIILIAVALVGLVAIIGLMIDGGLLLIEYARLKRGIDAASVSAAAQFRKGYNEDQLILAGEELLAYNQSVADVEIFTCDSVDHKDESLCPANTGGVKRKLVRVTATRKVTFGFLPVIGINGTTITATAVGEAASIDMVMVIDNSASMAYATYQGPNKDDDISDPGNVANPTRNTVSGSPGDNPYYCNAHDTDVNLRCEPFGTIKDVAKSFVTQLFFPYDRVAIVSLTDSVPGGTRDPGSVLHFNDNWNDGTNSATTEVQDAINDLKVFQPEICGIATTGPCLGFANPTPATRAEALAAPATYAYQGCPLFQSSNPADPTSCGSSNTGGALYQAGSEFSVAPIRMDSFWVVITLIGGPANATSTLAGHDYGLCPESTWPYLLPANTGTGYCRDRDPSPYSLGTATRHKQNVDLSYPANYDADDYARDAADALASPNGVGATIYSICVGSYCQNYQISKNYPDPATAEHLGQYMALNAGDSTIPPVTANHGLYFLAVDTSALGPIFDAIAANIFTRLSQ